MASVPYSFNYSNTTAVERQPVNSVDVWQDIAAIPANPATASGIVVSVSGALFTSISGNVYRYACPQFSTMVPGNYWGGAYQPTLKDSSGVNIPYNPTVWVADSTLKVIEFQSAAPKSLGYNPPFYLNYWQYTASGGIGPGGQIAATPSGNSLLATNVSSPQTLVSLLAGNNVSMELTNVTGGQLLTVDANLSSLGAPTVSGKSLIQLVPSATSAYGSPQESKLVSIAAGYGMNITSSIDAATGGAYLTFNSAGISGETIVFVNDGAGTPNSAGVYESTTGFTTYLRSIVGGAGIGVSQGASLIEIDNTTTGQSIGGGIPVYASSASGVLTFDTLAVGPSNNLTIGAAAGLITVDTATNQSIAGTLRVAGRSYLDGTAVGSLTISGAAIAPTAAAGDNSTTIATTAFVANSISGYLGPTHGQNINPSGVPVYVSTVLDTLNFNTLLAGPSNNLTISAASGLVTLDLVQNPVIAGKLGVVGATSLGSLSVSGASVMSGAVQAASMTVLGNEIVNGTLTVSGASTLAGLTAGASQVASLTVTGASNVPTATAGDSSNTIASTAFVANSISGFTGSGQGHNINPSGVPVYVNTSSGALNFNTLLAGPSNNLSITASGGLVTIDLVQNPVISQLSVIGASSLGSLSVSGQATLAGVSAGAVQVTSLANSGNSSVGGTLSVSGQATLAGVTAGAVQVTGMANSGNSSVGGTLSVSGASTLAGVSAGAVQVTSLANSGNSSVGGTLTVSGDTTFYGQATGLTVPLADISTHLATTQYVSNYVAATISGSSISGGIIVGNTTFADNVLFLKNITVSGSSSLQGVSIGGALTVNGSAGTAGQVLTASGSGAPYWGTAVVGSTNSAYATTALGYNASAGSGIYNTAIGFGATVPSGINHGIYLGTSTETLAIQGGLNLRIVNVPSQQAFPLYPGQGGSTIPQVYFISTAGAAHLPPAVGYIGATVAFRAANGTNLTGFSVITDDSSYKIYQLSGTVSQLYIPGAVQLCSFVSDGSNWYQMQ